MKWKYIKKLKDINCITKIENEYNIHIPQTLKDIIINYNGGRPFEKLFKTEKNDEKVIKSLLSYNIDDKENVYIFSEIFEKSFIPFAITEFGDVICINNKNENIELYLHELDTFEYICKNIDEFLNILYQDN